ncbi:hypothetical protein [Streptosporangium sandarakinum]|uniref:hypothetical protein n=1 Tax=Streptosporangium sandarakinum TaxID=1260955 RepID=UPI0037989C95
MNDIHLKATACPDETRCDACTVLPAVISIEWYVDGRLCVLMDKTSQWSLCVVCLGPIVAGQIRGSLNGYRMTSPHLHPKARARAAASAR